MQEKIVNFFTSIPQPLVRVPEIDIDLRPFSGALWLRERNPATCKPCIIDRKWRYLAMPLMNLTVAEEALSLAPADRAALARLLIESLDTDSRTDAEIKADLNSRLERLLSNKDSGLDFPDVFGVSS